MGVKDRWEITDVIQGKFSRKVLRRLRSMENCAAEWELNREHSRDKVLFSVAKF